MQFQICIGILINFNLVKVYSDPGNLVLVLGCSEQEEAWLGQRLALKGEKTLPRSVTAEVSTSERELVYLEGGVLFVTSRILVVDLLMERLPAHLVTGVVVWKALRVHRFVMQAVPALFHQRFGLA